jgi:hypothetical protein
MSTNFFVLTPISDVNTHTNLVPGMDTGVASRRLPPVPWRDPHSVEPAQLSAYISQIEELCQADPNSADLRTCLGMAYAMQFEVYKSMDALESARTLDPRNFWAQMKYSELQYRLRALSLAEQETLCAINLAGNAWELSVARKQLAEIRRLMRDGTQRPAWTKSLGAPMLALLILMIVLFRVALWLR